MRIRPEFCCLLAAALACNPSAGPGTGLQSVVPGNDTPLPVAEREAYRDDAARLALRYETQGGDPAAYPADIPTAYATALYNALIHVYTATGVAATDSVTSLYHVHTFGMPVTRELYLEVDTTLAWVRALRGGALPTGNTQVDQLLAAARPLRAHPRVVQLRCAGAAREAAAQYGRRCGPVRRHSRRAVGGAERPVRRR